MMQSCKRYTIIQTFCIIQLFTAPKNIGVDFGGHFENPGEHFGFYNAGGERVPCSLLCWYSHIKQNFFYGFAHIYFLLTAVISVWVELLFTIYIIKQWSVLHQTILKGLLVFVSKPIIISKSIASVWYIYCHADVLYCVSHRCYTS